MRKFIALAAIFLSCSMVNAGDRSQPATLSATTSIDPASQFQVYSYTLAAPASNTAPLETLTIRIPPGVDTVTGITSPVGWRAFYSAEQGALMWSAVGYLDSEAADESGNIPPSDYVIQPGSTLSGFSFKTFSIPGPVTAYVQSYAPLRSLDETFDEEAAEASVTSSSLPEENGLMLSTTGPLPAPSWDGNRRPAVDGFLIFVNVEPRTTFQGSALILFRLGSAGEQVDASTLRVDLNGLDVTSQFVFLPEYNGYVAVLSPDSSPVKLGSNVLKTSVSGIQPGGTRTVTDTDRLVFELIQ